MQKRSERGVEENRGVRSGDVKKGRSAERRCQKGPECGVIFTPRRAPVIFPLQVHLHINETNNI